jgi:hypothetical protein
VVRVIEEDELRPTRGVLVGLVLAFVFWFTAAGMWWVFG